MSEVLYTRSAIRRTLREILSNAEPTTIEEVIEQIDVRRAYEKLPAQYQQVFQTLLNTTEGETDWEMMVMELHEDKLWIEETLAAAWNHLYSMLNEPATERR